MKRLRVSEEEEKSSPSFSPSIQAVFFNADLVYARIGLQSCLSLMDRFCLARVNKKLYAKFINLDRALQFMRDASIMSSKFHLRPTLYEKMVRESGILECVKFIWDKNMPDPQNDMYKFEIYTRNFLKCVAVCGKPSVIYAILSQIFILSPRASAEIRTFLIISLLNSHHETLALEIFTNLNGMWWPNVRPLRLIETHACWQAAIQTGCFNVEAQLFLHMQQINGCAPVDALMLRRLAYALQSKSPNVVSIVEHFWNQTNNMQVQINFIVEGRALSILRAINHVSRIQLLDLLDRLTTVKPEWIKQLRGRG